MSSEQILTAINTTYILGALVAIGFLLAYIATRLQAKDKKSSKR